MLVSVAIHNLDQNGDSVMGLFMHHPLIKGEISDKNHKDWLDIIEVQFGTKRQITSLTSTQGDRESSNAKISNLKMMKYMDKASPKLFIETCCGRGNTIKLVKTKTGSGGGSQEFLEYTLENAIISKMNVEAIAESGFRPVEEYEISFTKLTKKYIQYDEDGNALAPVIVGFDTATNTKI